MNALFFRLQNRYAPYLFIAPFVVLFLTFTLYPIAKSLSLSFYITNGPKSQVFVGWDNFRFLWGDPAFHRAVWNTCIYALTSVFLQLPLSLGLALLLNSHLVKGRDFFRFGFFSPHLVGQVFVAVLGRQLSHGTPRIEVFNGACGFSVMPYMMQEGDAEVMSRRLEEIFSGI